MLDSVCRRRRRRAIFSIASSASEFIVLQCVPRERQYRRQLLKLSIEVRKKDQVEALTSDNIDFAVLTCICDCKIISEHISTTICSSATIR